MATQAAFFPPAPAAERGTATKISTHKDNVVYTNGRGVFIRNLKDPGRNISYFGHVKDTTLARVSPSGFYVASADVSGTIRVWDLAGSEQILKSEFKPIAGRINDLSWDSESKRIIAVGDGKERFGHAFMFDSGSSVGEISGHSKVVNAVAMRPSRPFRAATGGDDNSVVFLHGTPYKFAKVIRSHTSFVHSLAYSSSGSHFASASADRTIQLYDGASGDILSSNGIKGHDGGIFAVSFAPDSQSIATSSADQTCRTWDVETMKEISKWSFDAQQIGGCHLDDQIISVALNGDINVIDKRQASKAAQVLHVWKDQKGITSLVYSSASAPTFFSGSYDGRMNAFDPSGNCSPVSGAGHSNQIVALSQTNSEVRSAGMDDSLRTVDIGTKSFRSAFASTGNLPKGLASDANGASYIATTKDIQVVSASGQKEASLSANFTPTSIAYAVTAQIAVGGEDNKVRIYDKGLKLLRTLEQNRSAITALAYSADASLLAVGDSSGKILVYDATSGEVKINQWVFHTGRIASIQFSADGLFAVSGSLDTNIYVWSVAKPLKKVAIKNAHAGGVSATTWTSDTKIASAGADGCIRQWEFVLPV